MSRDIVLTHWHELPFEDFLGSKTAVIEFEDSEGTTDRGIVLAIDYAPNFYVAPHSHRTGHVEIILEGSLLVGDTWERAGDVRVVPANVPYGPIQVGPEGCKGLEFFPDREAVIPTVVDPDAAASHQGDRDHLIAQLRRLLKI